MVTNIEELVALCDEDFSEDDLMYIRDLLGHSTMMTIEFYARTDAKLKRKAIEAAGKEILPLEDAVWDTDANLKAWLTSFNKR
ncbi:Uncharacterised protein [[Eubacterium] contortum]|uniref:Tyr recombinase domain-containing protein n=1 Tax=Faecalicatena contorta TaxID=39482 RepID=A0A174GZC9_9FIRM|nr:MULTISPECIES: hypothetical protein [Clostridia]CUO66190.1 Uncharacterised protein [[Eubacterium] contortum] [Faecalicatena contorta]